MTHSLPQSQPALPSSPARGARLVMGIVTVVALHLLVFWLAGWAGSGATFSLPQLFTPKDPLLVLLVSLLQAWCSLGGVWLACSRWPSHVNALIGSLVSVSAWVGIVLFLTNTDFHSSGAAAWLVSLMAQSVTTALAVLVVERIRQGSVAAAGTRFTILTLLIWTTVVGVLLGAGRYLAEAFGWTWSGVVAWDYFGQLLVVGILNALLAVGLWTVLRQRPTWRGRLLAALAVVAITLVTANLLLFFAFKDAGVEPADICWLYGGQALFLLATMVPLQIATGESEQPPSPGAATIEETASPAARR